VIGVEDPDDASVERGRLALHDGAVCTSSPRRRRWTTTDGVVVHHLVDPATGTSRVTDIASVTVVAGEAWWAEVMTKAVLAAGIERASEVLRNASACVIADDGTITTHGEQSGLFTFHQ
jgi:thiamine biosynthesis lipoprotein